MIKIWTPHRQCVNKRSHKSSQLGGGTSDMFVQHVPQMIVGVEIWGIWRPPQTCCCAPQTVPEPSVLHGKTHYPADGSHSHQGILFPSRPILNTIFCLLSIRTRTLCQQSELQQLRFGPQSQPSLPTCINEPWPPMTLSLVLSVVSFDHF